MFFTIYGKLKRIIGDAPKQNLEHFYLYNLKFNDIAVNLYISKKRATKRVHIHCTESGDILWEQFYPFGGMSRPSREKKYVLKPQRDKNAITVVVVRGNPQEIIGLDDGNLKLFRTSLELGDTYLVTENKSYLLHNLLNIKREPQ